MRVLNILSKTFYWKWITAWKLTWMLMFVNFAFWPCLVLWLNSDSTKWFRLGIFILYLVYTFLTMKKNVVSLNGNRNLKIKFEFKIRNSFKQKLKLEFYVLFFEKLKINEKIHFLKGSLGDVTDRRSASAQKKISWKNEQKFIFQFLMKIEIGTSNLFFDLIMKTKNEKKKIKTLFHFKTKIECPFWPTD